MPTVRRLAATLGAALLAILIAAPVAAYNEENVASIGMTRLDNVSCTDDIRIRVELLDANDDPVPAAEVRFSFGRREVGDSLSPTSRVSNSAGRATVFVDLSCRAGLRLIRARVPGDGGGHIYINCRPRHGCTRGVSGAVLGVEETNPGAAAPLPAIQLPATSSSTPAVTSTPAVAPPLVLYLLGALMMAAIALRFIRPPRPGRREVEPVAPR